MHQHIGVFHFYVASLQSECPQFLYNCLIFSHCPYDVIYLLARLYTLVRNLQQLATFPIFSITLWYLFPVLTCSVWVKVHPTHSVGLISHKLTSPHR